MHQLRHLALYVKRYGPLWATTAFLFENESGIIANSVNAKSNIAEYLKNNNKYRIIYQSPKSTILTSKNSKPIKHLANWEKLMTQEEKAVIEHFRNRKTFLIFN